MSDKAQDKSDGNASGTDRSDNQSGDDSNKTNTSGDKSPVPPTIIGWVVRGLSLALIGALIVFLVYKAVGEDDRFDYEIKPLWDEAQPGPNGGHLVPIEITNKSSRAIRNWQIDVSQGGSEPVSIDMQLVGPLEKLTYVVELEQVDVPVDSVIVFYER
ncbi:hypothetical protein [Qipengyuania nanhaisediminis]|uniref:hypothetical protein n=1 Tax=Qipengyuania nanhaisediminis TaxID=604088 RepID=UPI0038B34B1C